jgi:L-cysteine/cystine lyase
VTFDEVRARFPVLRRVAYLNAGTFGPLSEATSAALAAEQRRDLEVGRAGVAFVEHAMTLREAVRRKIADLVGAETDQVALTQSTTDGCNIVLCGLGLTEDDEIVTTTDEHFGLLGPLGVSRARVIVVEPDPDRILAAVSPRTKLIALSQVLWTTGAALPVAEIRERARLPVLVDGAQSVGAIPVAFAGVDFLTVSGQKWLCGPDTTGALVVRDPDRLRVSRPGYFAQSSYEPDGSFEPRPGAQRFEPNWSSTGTLAGLLAAIEGRPEWAFSRAMRQAERLRSLLSPHVEVVTPAERATLVSFRAGADPADLNRGLQAQGIIVRDVPRTPFVRASVGYWTSDEDLERLVDAIRARVERR